MQRRTFLQHGLAAALFANPALQLFGRGYRPVAGEFNRIRGGVGYYTNKGGTIGVYLPQGRSEGGVIVDTQFPEQAADLLSTLREQHPLARLALLANTHHHGDHTGGNSIFRPLADQHVAHRRATDNLMAQLSEEGRLGDVAVPKTSFEGSWSTNLPDGKEIVTLRHFGAAHTGGDAVVHFENANVAHIGDLLFNRRFPYIDPAGGGDILNWVNVLKKIRATYNRNTIYIFGHAAEGYPVFGTNSDIKAFENYLRALQRYVRRERRKGTTLEDLKAKTVTIPGAAQWKFGERLRDVNLEVMYTAMG